MTYMCHNYEKIEGFDKSITSFLCLSESCPFQTAMEWNSLFCDCRYFYKEITYILDNWCFIDVIIGYSVFTLYIHYILLSYNI